MHFGFFPILGPIEVIVLASAFILVWPTWRICTKAGFPGPLGLLVILPVLNLVLLFFLGFAEWPSLRRRKPEADKDL